MENFPPCNQGLCGNSKTKRERERMYERYSATWMSRRSSFCQRCTSSLIPTCKRSVGLKGVQGLCRLFMPKWRKCSAVFLMPQSILKHEEKVRLECTSWSRHFLALMPRLSLSEISAFSGSGQQCSWGQLWKLNNIMSVKCLSQFHAQNRCPIHFCYLCFCPHGIQGRLNTPENIKLLFLKIPQTCSWSGVFMNQILF